MRKKTDHMRIGVLGLGAWGFCLAYHLSMQGHTVTAWTRHKELASSLLSGKEHPNIDRSISGLSIHPTTNIEEVIEGSNFLIESVTTSGLREVMTSIERMGYSPLQIPLILTSKGVERPTHYLPPQIIESIFSPEAMKQVVMLSGPSFAQEVVHGLPTAVVCGSSNIEMSEKIAHLFSNPAFRVYPNEDILGVSLGGALKNVIAIASGIADGLELGTGAKAALVTRGLHEMVKLSTAIGGAQQTLYGLSGLGDLYLTCSSPLSRNFRFGKLLSEGFSKKAAEKHIGMVIEGASTATAAFELSEQYSVAMPIMRAVYEVIHNKIEARDAVKALMKRLVKEERL
ncbi:MAG: NAD(P)H-dependent glycerol-3-phosphate dehydrogenase [Chlamydia sp.]